MKTIVLLMAIMLMIGGCGDDRAAPDSFTGGSSEKISSPPTPPTPPTPPVKPSSPFPASESSVSTETATATTPAATGTIEKCRYAGRYNGDKPTWYCSKKMSAYPGSITVDITGCFKKTVKNNGSRYQDNQLIIKQSEVTGRGLAIVAAASCKSVTAYLGY